MKTLKLILIIIFMVSVAYSQSIVIGTGAEINLGSGADICPTTFGNITGNLTGAGTLCNGIMPVEMMMFTATVNKTTVDIHFQTASELYNYGFEVYRTTKNMTNQWNKISFIKGHGNNNTVMDYLYSDKNLNTGKYYYRLKQIDNNGNSEIFNLKNFVVITAPDKFELSQNYPNPFNPVTKIDFLFLLIQK